ncbi:toll/interleukin-1 receptor domain-containing protein [Micromonospora tulbaghiae]|uniref:Toll/interleukin-1 receptor domain-containing protein n=1 Tax=Micromonospora tulbaghiae TaxID=479978 RepID=A0AAW4JKM3_9ACTN|nr:toll/interleukin-1 receptor domain-containing protein [Micromonospora tulbaghiae]MBO4142089.1 toll/interleukin-1 receptor domain-containing protein [Micromonospora tulbaghiae]
MKIFISWSGEPSRQVARALREWLSVVAQHVEPWMSDEEIQSGTRWNDSIAHSLDATNFGIVCVTRANQAAPWLMFEAGALAKGLEQARVVPLCIDLEPSDITSPLHAFQARRFNKEGLRRLIHELSELAEQPRPRESIDTLFEAMWPQLEKTVSQAATMTASAVPGKPRRSQEDMLAELVTRVRNIERETEHRESEARSDAIALAQRADEAYQALEQARRDAAAAAAKARSAADANADAEARAALLDRRYKESEAMATELRFRLAHLEKSLLEMQRQEEIRKRTPK